ncbi:hypothetical protein LTR37_008062 [Vermiconidia calcicola]|uniref:Uncharacterized protein n=1 Tax=Vermiconidia calcicola TaxID=1690605 RepID=A0ACC3NC76_9PEZI|nr:hypothetical protein LTR37_008062 [Vermiconidia calcicola]
MALDWLTEDAKVDVHQLSFDSSENSVGSLHNMAYWTEQGSLEGASKDSPSGDWLPVNNIEGLALQTRGDATCNQHSCASQTVLNGWKGIAVEAVVCDRELAEVFHRGRNIHDQIQQSELRAHRCRNSLDELQALEESISSDVEIVGLQSLLDGLEKELEKLAVQFKNFEQDEAHHRSRRVSSVNRLLAHFVDADTDADTFYHAVTDDTLESFGSVLEIQEQIGEEGANRAELRERASNLKMQIDDLTTRLSLDTQLEQVTARTKMFIDKRIARNMGTYYSSQTEISHCEGKLDAMSKYRNQASDRLCEALEDLLEAEGLIDTDPRRGQDTPDGATSQNATDRNSSEEIDNTDDPEHLRSRSQSQDRNEIDFMLQTKRIAKARHAKAWQKFNELKNNYRKEAHWFEDLKRRQGSRSDFDRAYLKSQMLWTSRIIAAEDDLQQARVDIRNSSDGVVAPSADSSSIYPDLLHDGYAESEENMMKDSVDGNKLERWLREIDENEAPLERPVGRHTRIGFSELDGAQQSCGDWLQHQLHLPAYGREDQDLEQDPRLGRSRCEDEEKTFQLSRMSPIDAAGRR